MLFRSLEEIVPDKIGYARLLEAILGYSIIVSDKIGYSRLLETILSYGRKSCPIKSATRGYSKLV